MGLGVGVWLPPWGQLAQHLLAHGGTSRAWGLPGTGKRCLVPTAGLCQDLQAALACPRATQPPAPAQPGPPPRSSPCFQNLPLPAVTSAPRGPVAAEVTVASCTCVQVLPLGNWTPGFSSPPSGSYLQPLCLARSASGRVSLLLALALGPAAASVSPQLLANIPRAPLPRRPRSQAAPLAPQHGGDLMEGFPPSQACSPLQPESMEKPSGARSFAVCSLPPRAEHDQTGGQHLQRGKARLGWRRLLLPARGSLAPAGNPSLQSQAEGTSHPVYKSPEEPTARRSGHLPGPSRDSNRHLSGPPCPGAPFAPPLPQALEGADSKSPHPGARPPLHHRGRPWPGGDAAIGVVPGSAHASRGGREQGTPRL